VPDFTALLGDGTQVKFSELAKGKTVVLSFWSAGMGLPEAALAFNNAWAAKYAAQGVLFVGVAADGKREEFDKWYAAMAKLAFPCYLIRPAVWIRPRRPPRHDDEEKQAYKAASAAYYAKVIPMSITGGVMAPVPNNLVIDSKAISSASTWVPAPNRRFARQSLLRSGVKLAADDVPAKVFTPVRDQRKTARGQG